MVIAIVTTMVYASSCCDNIHNVNLPCINDTTFILNKLIVNETLCTIICNTVVYTICLYPD